MDVDSVVYNHYHGIRRYGIVESKRIAKNRWAYFKVRWFADEVYQDAMSFRKQLTNKDYGLTEYRKDQLVAIDLDKESSIFKDIKAELNVREEND